jgi:hypothetical protein
MRSTRLAVASVVAGSALLGWSAAGVTTIADKLPGTPAPPARQASPDLVVFETHPPHPDFDHDRDW